MRRTFVGILLTVSVVLGLNAVAAADAPYPPEPYPPAPAQGVEVGGSAASQEPLPYTGSDTSGTLAGVGVGIVLAGGAMVVVAQRRRSVGA